MNNDLQHVINFLRQPTPSTWLNYAANNINLLLIDHAHCERKAAATALNFISRYPELSELVQMMSPLAREELLHFEKVLILMQNRNLVFAPLKPSNYAYKLHSIVAKSNGQERLRDQLLVGALIEARSCERFFSLIKVLEDPTLSRFYTSLVKAEARHFEDYLKLAHLYGKQVENKLTQFLDLENELINSPENVFRFHSGIPTDLE